MIDRFGREITYLRLSVTELCNLRCRYCMPAEGVPKRSHDEMLTQEEMLLAVRAAAELGITKLRGRFHEAGHFQVLPTFHPAATIYHPDWLQDLEADMRLLGEWLAAHPREEG